MDGLERPPPGRPRYARARSRDDRAGARCLGVGSADRCRDRGDPDRQLLDLPGIVHRRLRPGLHLLPPAAYGQSPEGGPRGIALVLAHGREPLSGCACMGDEWRKGHAATHSEERMRRIYVLAIGTLLTLGALAGTALAKEGAVTKLDALPSGGIHAGQMIPIGFTILMDGVEPYKADVAEIVVRNGTGKVLSYPATPQGPAGHYVANVYFPAAGTYTWQATQGTYFAPFHLGPAAGLGPVTASEARATPATTLATTDPISQAIPFLAGLIALGASVRLAQLLRSHRRVSATA